MAEERLMPMFFQRFDFDDAKNIDDLLLQLLTNVCKLSKQQKSFKKTINIYSELLTCIYSAATLSSSRVVAYAAHSKAFLCELPRASFKY